MIHVFVVCVCSGVEWHHSLGLGNMEEDKFGVMSMVLDMLNLRCV